MQARHLGKGAFETTLAHLSIVVVAPCRCAGRHACVCVCGGRPSQHRGSCPVQVFRQARVCVCVWWWVGCTQSTHVRNISGGCGAVVFGGCGAVVFKPCQQYRPTKPQPPSTSTLGLSSAMLPGFTEVSLKDGKVWRPRCARSVVTTRAHWTTVTLSKLRSVHHPHATVWCVRNARAFTSAARVKVNAKRGLCVVVCKLSDTGVTRVVGTSSHQNSVTFADLNPKINNVIYNWGKNDKISSNAP